MTCSEKPMLLSYFCFGTIGGGRAGPRTTPSGYAYGHEVLSGPGGKVAPRFGKGVRVLNGSMGQSPGRWPMAQRNY